MSVKQLKVYASVYTTPVCIGIVKQRKQVRLTSKVLLLGRTKRIKRMDGRKKQKWRTNQHDENLFLRHQKLQFYSVATRYFHYQHLLYIDFVPGALQGFVAVEAVPATGGSLGLMGILQVICTKRLTFLDTWKTFCLIMFVDLMNSSILPASPFRFLMKKHAMSYNFIFLFYTALNARQAAQHYCLWAPAK